jgi:hypothetical protein
LVVELVQTMCQLVMNLEAMEAQVEAQEHIADRAELPVQLQMVKGTLVDLVIQVLLDLVAVAVLAHRH